MAAHPEPLNVLDRERRPLDPAEIVEALSAISAESPALAAVLDHVCIRLDGLAEFTDSIGPMLDGLGAISESLAVGGLGGLMGIMTAASPRAD